MGLIRYTTSVDSDVDYDPRQFAEEVAIYLADPEGWAQWHTFVVGKGKTIRLSSPHTLKKGCGDDTLSCATLGGNEIWLNAKRWMEGATPSKLPLERYRQYMVTHEMGHSLGYEHAKCSSGPAPVMMQQTLGIGKCSPNTAVTPTDLTRLLSKSSRRSQ
jgi:ssRNA-specific RNase YbeY (16S rRNA maturation enzyme)